MERGGSVSLALVRPAVDAHGLGMSAVAQLLSECGIRTIIADRKTCELFGHLDVPAARDGAAQWLRNSRVTWLGLSYRLDPEDGLEFVGRVLRFLRGSNLHVSRGGPIAEVYFAGLPTTCRAVSHTFPLISGVFPGDETPSETLRIFGLNPSILPTAMKRALTYDDDRLAFGRDFVGRQEYRAIGAVDRGGYPGYGTTTDSVRRRIEYSRRRLLPPLTRVHLGPYQKDRSEAVRLFLDWTGRLAQGGLLDVLSTGTSQLTQEAFGEDWGERDNGGGVPINSPEEYRAVWDAARPMLVRTYAGTRNVPVLARIHEQTLNIAWHALSLWWFCRIDGRGPNTVMDNLTEHLMTLRYIADTRKPFEPNVPHHFAFRGGDDVTYIVSAYLAARAARAQGVQTLILQNMLNTPKQMWGLMDLARSRAMLRLVRELEGPHFRVFLQTRGGLDYFSPQEDKAKAQLAAVTALMDDIEPNNPMSPSIIHVVSYSEAYALADPSVVEESIRIVLGALKEYRSLRASGHLDVVADRSEVEEREEHLLREAHVLLKGIRGTVGDLTSATGLYQVLALGFFAVPYLWECRDEFAAASRQKTAVIRGGVDVVDVAGRPVSATERVAAATARAGLSRG